MTLAYDLVGKKLGRLTVIKRSGSIKNRAAWLCECECGNHHRITSTQLMRSKYPSCGCYKTEVVVKTKTKHGHSRVNNLSSTYTTWSSMKRRCDNPNDRAYQRYGGRGITYDPRWANFEEFLKDMGERPSSGMSLDRIDNNKGYSKNNCRWTTVKVQNRNRRSSKMVEFRGQIKSLAEWSEELGVSYHMLQGRLSKGWSIEEAFTKPRKKLPTKRVLLDSVEYNGKSQSLQQWSEELNVPYKTLHHRIRNGHTIEEALSEPLNYYQEVIEYNGKSQNLADWAKELNMPYHKLYLRIKRRNWPLERAFAP